MASTAYYQWKAAGEPYEPAQPIREIVDVLRGHGYTVYHKGDTGHMTAEPPEDHTPFSATGWPDPSKRWVGHALDVMPEGAPVPLPRLARQVIADKDAKVPGTKWLKYMNWTDENGDCWREDWRSGERVQTRSTDKGHIHMSGRSDMDTSTEVATSGWDPVARAMEDDMTPADFLKLLRDPAVAAQMRAFAWQYTGGGLPPDVSSTLATLTQIWVATSGAKVPEKLTAIAASLDEANKKLDALASGGVPPADLEELKTQLEAIRDDTERLVAATKAAGLAVT